MMLTLRCAKRSFPNVGRGLKNKGMGSGPETGRFFRSCEEQPDRLLRTETQRAFRLTQGGLFVELIRLKLLCITITMYNISIST